METKTTEVESRVEVAKDSDGGMDNTYVTAPGFWLAHHIHPSGNVNTSIMAHHEDHEFEFVARANTEGLTSLAFESCHERHGSKGTSVFVKDSDLVAIRDLLTKRIAAVRRANKEGA